MNWLKRFFGYRVLTELQTKELKAAFGDDKVLIVVDSLMWADAPINLAGYHFKNCDFVRCELMFNGMPFQMTNCRFNGIRMIDVIYQPKGNKP